jgi:alkyl hydroperoxide reductase subunit AhpC
MTRHDSDQMRDTQLQGISVDSVLTHVDWSRRYASAVHMLMLPGRHS